MEIFNLKTEPWFIRVNSPEESEAAQKWLFSRDIGWVRSGHTVETYNIRHLTNVGAVGEVRDCIMWSNSPHTDAEEIKLSFTLAVNKATFPEQREKIEFNGKLYYKEDIEKALSLLKEV